MVYTWGNSGLGDLDSTKLYAAVHSGADILKSVNCDEKYPQVPANSCKIFEWQSDKMSLDFDSNELPESTKERKPKHVVL